MTPEEKIEKLSASIDKLTHQMETQNLKIENKALEDKVEKMKENKESSGPWWSTLIKFLGLPAALILLVFNYKQTDNLSADKEKIGAETEKIRLETLGTRLKLLTDSVSLQKIENAEDRLKLRKDVTEINRLIDEIRIIKYSSSSNILVTQVIVLYLFYIGLHLIMYVFRFLWGNLFTLVFYSLQRNLSKKRENIPYEDKEQRRRLDNKTKYLQWGMISINYVPAVITVFIEILIFIAVVIPLFNSASADLQSSITFGDLIDSLKHLDINGAVKSLKSILFQPASK